MLRWTINLETNWKLALFTDRKKFGFKCPGTKGAVASGSRAQRSMLRAKSTMPAPSTCMLASAPNKA